MKFKNPWYLIESEKEKINLETELKKEINKKHILYAQNAVAFARNASDDNVVYKLNDEKFALVHLTWIGAEEGEKEFPFTRIFESMFDLMKVIERDF